jgi:hypothetical protein
MRIRMIITILFSILLLLVLSLFLARYKKHRKKKNERRSRETWVIGIYKGPSPLTLFPPTDINNPILSATDVTDVKARFVADPFMAEHKGGYYLFFEVLNDKRDAGEIGYAFSSDCVQWEYRKIILKERFHLSYPYLFNHEGHHYMIPECAGSGGIQLYQAKHFPEQWQHIATLVKGHGRYAALADPSIFSYRNRWYLFSYCGKDKSLHLFTSERLTGAWQEHPKSPVATGTARFARPGGRVTIHEGHIYRYSQDETPNYGTRVWAFRITELSEKSYSEEPAAEKPVVEPGNEWWNRSGMHTVDPHQTKTGEWIALVDGFTISE